MDFDIVKLKENWERFTGEGILNEDVDPTVAVSWQKCRRHGVDPEAGVGKKVDGELFQSILRENQTLLDIARPIMQSVFDIVHQSHFLMVLTDSVGYLIETIGDATIGDRAKDLRFELGTLWNDLEVGSNAIGVALDYDTPIQMIGPEHYCVSHHSWTCSAAPIHGMGGEVIGCFNMSGFYNEAHKHTLAVAKLAAFAIETQLRNMHNASLMQTSLDANTDGMVLLDNQFFPIWANVAALALLETGRERIEAIGDIRRMLPEVDWEEVQGWHKGEQYFTNDTRLVLAGKTIPCSVTISPTMEIGRNKTYSVTIKKQEQVIRAVNMLSGNRATYTFDNIFTASPSMRKTVTLARTFSGYEGVVLIEGESGTGKELFAQALHNASSRAKNPFIAINCASLPRDLIESELFGYEKGAFTGAHKEGNMGKFELADSGTIFLDEIGELPLEFQAKLLRVVETRQVRRLGGNVEKKLDVRIIAATNRNLRREVEYGRFRGDLFFRLNVLWLQIPPLRERKDDIALCAEKFLDHFNHRYPELRKTMTPEFVEGLMEYHWPGNVRELQNGIERAFYSGSDDVLTLDDLSIAIGIPLHPPRTEPQLIAGPALDRQALEDALRASGGNVERAAKSMGTSRASLYRQIKKLGLNAKAYK
ncbi:MAG: sigma-54-dependent Fis family transcriptional regulator [Planctomycetaceae bacterium]|nr:sigma-54-dependent Fis family transcriptional regulator [Planctomycetaceae bacterium]